jgi:hypothetical protein
MPAVQDTEITLHQCPDFPGLESQATLERERLRCDVIVTL